MSLDADNGEIIVKDSKSGEEYKSPGRLAAEERAERIRTAEEYRKKLEAEKAPLPPKKTKAAEQKEQAKLEQIAREQQEIQELLEEQRLESAQRISAAKEKLASLNESIEKAEAAPPVPEIIKVEKPETSEPQPAAEPKKKPSAIKLKNLVVHIPVQSFSFPCAVKRTKTKVTTKPETVKKREDTNRTQQNVQIVQPLQYAQPFPYTVMPQMMQTTMIVVPPSPPPPPPPYIPIPPYMPPQPKPVQPKEVPKEEPKVETTVVPVEEKPMPQPKPKTALALKPNPAEEPKPNAELPVKPEPEFRELSADDDFKFDPVFRPVISYGATVTSGGWEYEIEDEEEIAEKNMPIDEDPTLVSTEELDPDIDVDGEVSSEQPQTDESDSVTSDANENDSSLIDIEGEFSEPASTSEAQNAEAYASSGENTLTESPVADTAGEGSQQSDFSQQTPQNNESENT